MKAPALIERRLRPAASPSVAFIACSPVTGHLQELARGLGGEAHCYYPFPGLPRPLVPLRHAAAGVQTAWYLLRRRPRAVLATTPPLFPALIATAYGRLTRAPVILDRQADWFSLQGPPAWTVEPPHPLGARPRVLFVGAFARDEPVSEVIEAARLLPSVDFWITGEPRRCPSRLQDSAPSNVTFVGSLRGSDHPRAIAAADLVLTLSEERTSAIRATYDAVYAGRPLVVSDCQTLRRLFPHAIQTASDAAAIAGALRGAIADHPALVAAAGRARLVAQRRWDAQIGSLRSLLHGATPWPAAADVEPAVARATVGTGRFRARDRRAGSVPDPRTQQLTAGPLNGEAS